MEERLEYNIPWSINPFVRNPHHRLHGSGHTTPGSETHHLESSNGPAMVTIQQVQVSELLAADRRASVTVDVNPFSETGAPKASFAELFYDLFFVASLTSFGIKHEITTDQAIASYVAFFSILWYIPRDVSHSGGYGLLKCCMMFALKQVMSSIELLNSLNFCY